MSRGLDWMDHAACKDHPNPDLFFPSETGVTAREQAAEAAQICGGCPVQAECADYRSETGASAGVWGGSYHVTKSPRKGPRPIKHGTDWGYHLHRGRGEQACERCRFAHAYAEQKRAGA